jgi:hypothetical protein
MADERAAVPPADGVVRGEERQAAEAHREAGHFSARELLRPNLTDFKN